MKPSTKQIVIEIGGKCATSARDRLKGVYQPARRTGLREAIALKLVWQSAGMGRRLSRDGYYLLTAAGTALYRELTNTAAPTRSERYAMAFEEVRAEWDDPKAAIQRLTKIVETLVAEGEVQS